MSAVWIRELEEKSGLSILQHRSISGGDISDAFLLNTLSGKYFLKSNSAADAYRMFAIEQAGLAALEVHPAIRIPKVFGVYQLSNRACLLMEYIDSKIPSPADWRLFGASLAELHQQKQAYFGWEQANYIGRLPQSNKRHEDWSAFYVEERLLPQIDLAFSSGLLRKQECPVQEALLQGVQVYFAAVQASILHGDLWSGNFLFDEQGRPCLIDPATYFGHSEVDLAMSRLFGGFSPLFYEAYAQKMPEQAGAAQRQDLYQLYYLLVHLNLFGSSYYGSVKRLLRQYF
jgi:fructosamine-3-kinase